MTWDELCELARDFPGTTVDRWYGTPALKLGGKGYVRLKDDATVVFLLDGMDTQDALLASSPAVYFLTDHYVGWPAILARLPVLTRNEARDRLEHAWRTRATPSQLAALDAGPPTKATKPTKKPKTKPTKKPTKKAKTKRGAR